MAKVHIRQELLKLALARVKAGEQTLDEALAQARASELRRRKLERIISEALVDTGDEGGE